MVNNFYFTLRTQYENLGDYLIAQATVDLLSKFGNIVLDTRNVPQNYIDLFTFPENVQLVKQDLIITLLSSKKGNWFYVVKPGGYNNAQDIKRKMKLFAITLYLSIAKIVFNIKLLKMPHSFNGTLALTDQCYQNKFDLNLCRDLETYSLYSLSNVQNMHLIPDFAMYYINKSSKFFYSDNEERKNIVISLRYDRLNNESEIAMNIADKLLVKDSLSEIIIVTQVTFDYDLNRDLAEKQNKKHVLYTIDNQSLTDIIKIYKSSKYIISNRLHVLLLGLINGAIPIAIIDTDRDKKILGCLELLNIPWIEKDRLLDNESFFSNLKYFQESFLNSYSLDLENDLKKVFNLLDNEI